MTKASKVRWLVAAVTSGILLIAMNAGAVKAVEAVLQVVSGTCQDPPGKQLVALGRGLSVDQNTVYCMAEAALGTTAIGNCDHLDRNGNPFPPPRWVEARGGVLDTTTLAFTVANGGIGGLQDWQDGLSSVAPSYAPPGTSGCVMKATAIAKN